MERVDASAAGLERAAEVLRAGGLVAYPTETFYGVAADIWQPEALARLLALKGRAPLAPLPLILPSREHVATLVEHIPEAAQRLMDRHWPGPLTLVLPAREGLPEPLVGPHGVGVRCSGNRVATELAGRLDAPLVATSANRTGEPPAETVDQVAQHLPGVDLAVDGGPSAGGSPSTVVAVSPSGELKVLRQGAIEIPDHIPGSTGPGSTAEAGADPLDGCVRDEALRGRLALWQPEQGYRFSVDALLLADFARGADPGWQGAIVDLGAGCGVVGLALAAQLPAARVILVELQARLAGVCRANVRENGFAPRVDVVEADLRRLKGLVEGASVERVVSNPPFHPAGTGRQSPDPEKAVANMELEVSLPVLVACAARLLRPRGRFSVIYPADRVVEVCENMTHHGLRPVRMRPVYPRADRPARRVLVQGRKGVSDPLVLDQPLVIHEASDIYTPEAARILSGR